MALTLEWSNIVTWPTLWNLVLTLGNQNNRKIYESITYSCGTRWFKVHKVTNGTSVTWQSLCHISYMHHFLIYTKWDDMQHMSVVTKTKCVQSKFASEERSEEPYLEIFTFNLKFDHFTTNKMICPIWYGRHNPQGNLE